MARPLTPQSLNLIFGGATIVVVLLLAAYFYFVLAKVEDQPATAKQYDLHVVTGDLKAPDDTNVFLKTVALPAAQPGDYPVVSYQSSDIGKQDLTQLNK